MSDEMRPLRYASSAAPNLGKPMLCRLPAGSVVYRLGRTPGGVLFETELRTTQDVAIFVREGFCGEPITAD